MRKKSRTRKTRPAECHANGLPLPYRAVLAASRTIVWPSAQLNAFQNSGMFCTVPSNGSGWIEVTPAASMAVSFMQAAGAPQTRFALCRDVTAAPCGRSYTCPS